MCQFFDLGYIAELIDTESVGSYMTSQNCECDLSRFEVRNGNEAPSLQYVTRKKSTGCAHINERATE
jgi:hypothetical protein